MAASHESLLFQWNGTATIDVEGQNFSLAPYDTHTTATPSFSIANQGDTESRIVQASVPATERHPVFHSRFADSSKREERIRRLKGKDVYLMFDVSEQAGKLVAGYTFFLSKQLLAPAQSHRPGGVLLFHTRPRAMEAYESPETLHFVHSVSEAT